mmetsp:Transcript_6589/g.21986  ORF Transcript_6589/g.21986 Transcript_6589/m.21986 type:complete len:227 (+) Transcript_6589:1043-1723(+)
MFAISLANRAPHSSPPLSSPLNHLTFGMYIPPILRAFKSAIIVCIVPSLKNCDISIPPSSSSSSPALSVFSATLGLANTHPSFSLKYLAIALVPSLFSSIVIFFVFLSLGRFTCVIKIGLPPRSIIAYKVGIELSTRNASEMTVKPSPFFDSIIVTLWSTRTRTIFSRRSTSWIRRRNPPIFSLSSYLLYSVQKEQQSSAFVLLVAVVVLVREESADICDVTCPSL